MISPVLSHGIAISWSTRMNLEAGQASAGGMTRRHWTTAGLSWGVVQLSCFRLVIHRGINVSTYIETHKYMEWIKTYYTISGGMNIWISIYQFFWVHQGTRVLTLCHMKDPELIMYVCLMGSMWRWKKPHTLAQANRPKRPSRIWHLSPGRRVRSNTWVPVPFCLRVFKVIEQIWADQIWKVAVLRFHDDNLILHWLFSSSNSSSCASPV